MNKTYVNVIKADAKINVPFTTNDVAALQAILLRHISGTINLDQATLDTIDTLCARIDDFACEQHQMETKEIEF